MRSGQCLLSSGGYRPADNFPGEQVNHNGQRPDTTSLRAFGVEYKAGCSRTISLPLLFEPDVYLLAHPALRLNAGERNYHFSVARCIRISGFRPQIGITFGQAPAESLLAFPYQPVQDFAAELVVIGFT